MTLYKNWLIYISPINCVNFSTHQQCRDKCTLLTHVRGTSHGHMPICWRASWELLTTLQPGQSGPFSHILRRAWIPPPHWAVQRSHGPQPVQNTWGGHNRCSLQYLWEEADKEPNNLFSIETKTPPSSLFDYSDRCLYKKIFYTKGPSLIHKTLN